MSEPETLGSIRDITERLGIKSHNTIYNKMRLENFPKPITIGTRTKRWLYSEVDDWIQEKINQRAKP